jgi:glycosyltransferase involved in cell wall biosynthesis
VSIITPVYNGSKYLEELIKSVREQDYPRIEHIIIDDGSKDNGATVDILKHHSHLRWWSRENRGAYATMNEGLKAATGDIATFICCDDMYEDSGAISYVVDLWNRMPDIDGFCGEIKVINESGDTLVKRWRYFRWPASLIKYINYLPHCSFFFDRCKMREGSFFFDTELPYVADAEWAIKLVMSGFPIYYSNRIISRNRQHRQQRSNNDGGSPFMSDVIKLHQRHNVTPAAFKVVLKMQNVYQRLGSSFDDMREGDLNKAWNRFLHGNVHQLK